MVGDSLSGPGPYGDGAPVAQLPDRGADVAGKQPRGDYAGRFATRTLLACRRRINAELDKTEEFSDRARTR